jgi:hypothetical protein
MVNKCSVFLRVNVKMFIRCCWLWLFNVYSNCCIRFSKGLFVCWCKINYYFNIAYYHLVVFLAFFLRFWGQIRHFF